MRMRIRFYRQKFSFFFQILIRRPDAAKARSSQRPAATRQAPFSSISVPHPRWRVAVPEPDVSCFFTNHQVDGSCSFFNSSPRLFT
jgi:hypothetical protein